AVRVDATRPADLEDLVLARVGLVQRRRELDRLQLQIEAALLDLSLDRLAEAPGVRCVADDHAGLHRHGDARRGQQRLGGGRVVLRARLRRVARERAGRADRAARRAVLAAEHNLVDRVAVEAHLERLAYALVGRDRPGIRRAQRLGSFADTVDI